MSLQGKVALVTGAAQGLGKGFAEILLKNGAKVALLDINEAVGKDLKSAFDKEYGPDSTVFLKCDVKSDDQFKEAFEAAIKKFHKIDIVCNNAGIVDEKDWERALATNLGGVIRGTYLALSYMKKQNGGHGGVIINVASMAGILPLLTAPIYTATKHGVLGFSRAISDLSRVCNFGVRINTLCPSFAETAILSSMYSADTVKDIPSLQEMNRKIINTVGILDVSVVAEAFLQLATDESKNGSALMVTKKHTGDIPFPKVSEDLANLSSMLPL
ncbi:15-hydroxyprostaglandin dehydrogenase [NAD(+)] [Paramormyrops kingsleyae]|uniref:15-hydroxyprostaglandin dehydrogenase [NAD(+)] n=1 Tax=Paramormyrops kingsleyae TaxID=1676925 RepID=A0A3B3SEH4_9TELE|nr:15-hydroxyprostaglandin dehydrogenase [NAD(+)]-like [Paramormyrops kingsleyae]XP_023700877.1 15-hydroxyprostaglandin dehydrogenase [NAD(+)]-like [Paramormyrops kingsleyae]XP_023700879.1 15-hydroxyprostaglandin dehydrogenase [NAD(+)]-like [Paramormyrops kingsleyae]